MPFLDQFFDFGSWTRTALPTTNSLSSRVLSSKWTRFFRSIFSFLSIHALRCRRRLAIFLRHSECARELFLGSAGWIVYVPGIHHRASHLFSSRWFPYRAPPATVFMVVLGSTFSFQCKGDFRQIAQIALQQSTDIWLLENVFWSSSPASVCGLQQQQRRSWNDPAAAETTNSRRRRRCYGCAC